MSRTKLTGLPSLFFDKDNTQGIWTSPINAIQKSAGFNDGYDKLFALIEDENLLKVEFPYNGENYRIEFWKAHYLNMGMGGEIGFYKNAKNGIGHYDVVDEADYLNMSFSLYDASDSQNEKLLFTRYPQAHWWLTGFKPDAPKIQADNLHMVGEVSFKNSDMRKAFLNTFNAKESKEFDLVSNDLGNTLIYKIKDETKYMKVRVSDIDPNKIYFEWLSKPKE